MKKIVFSIFICLIFVNIFAQKTKNLTQGDSHGFIMAGIEAYEHGKYKEAENYFQKVSFGDTLYYWSIYEQALAKYTQQQYAEAIALLEKIPEYTRQIRYNSALVLLANTYDAVGQPEKAIELYEKGAKTYPYIYSFYYEKGIALFYQGKYEEAALFFKQSIFCSPTHQRSHLMLAITYLKRRAFISGILALNYAVTINPNTELALSALKILVDLYVNGLNSYDVLPEEKIDDKFRAANSKYKPLEALINSGVATSKKFTAKTDIKHQITLQNQLVFENIIPNHSSKDVVDMLYAPIFINLVKNKNIYNTFCYYILQSTNVNENKVSEKAKKMKIELDKLVKTIIAPELTQSISKGIEQPDRDLTCTYSDNYNLSQMIEVNFDEIEGEQTIQTDIEEGVVRRVLILKSMNIGVESHIYDMSANLLYTYLIDNGEFLGDIIEYFPQREGKKLQIKKKCRLNADSQYDGGVTKYNYAGILEERSFWKNDLYDGHVEQYYPQGSLKFDGTYKNGNYADNSTAYYENGKIKSQILENVGGTFSVTDYYTNGKIKQTALMKNSDYVGKVESFYATGEKKTESYFNENGEKEGNVIAFYKTGNMSEISHYVNDTLTGTTSFYSPSGKKSVDWIYQNNKIRQIITYNNDGSVREKITPQNGIFKYDAYIHDENNISFRSFSCAIDEMGNKQGICSLYTPQGGLASKYNYKNDQQDGDMYDYFPSGNISGFYQMKEGVVQGLSVEYYENGNVKREAICKNDNVVGAQYTYNQNGDLTILYDIDESGVLNNVINYYNNKVSSKYLFDGQIIIGFEQYDMETDSLITKQTFENGNGIEAAYHLNGKINTITKRVAGLVKDTVFTYDFSGKLLSKNVYNEGKIAGDVFNYSNVTGELVCFQQFNAGVANGKWIYYEDGRKIQENNMAENEINGESISYFANGKIDAIRSCSDSKDETITYFASDGKTICRKIKCFHGIPYAISVAGKDGKMSDFQQLTKEKMSFISYYPTGTVSGEFTYENGFFSGSQKIYYPNSKLCREYVYENGDIIAGKEFFESGIIYCERNYSLEERNGFWRYYYPDGKLKREEHYLFGKLDGEVKCYDSSGKLVETQLWFNDMRKK